MEKQKKKIRIKLMFFVALLMIGAIAIGYPFLTQYFNYQKSQVVINEYIKSSNQTDETEVNKRIKEAQAYNELLFRGTSKDKVSDPFSNNSNMSSDYAKMLKINDEIGVISIPTISQEIPVYAGTSQEALEKGAGHMQGTSLPVGGNNTHSVITAHRGLPDKRLFTDLDKLKVNDFFYYKYFNKVLAYQVDDIKVITPEEIDKLKIEPGHDYMTLLTCTPYMVNTHRLLVRGHRVEFEQYLMDRQINDSRQDNTFRYLFYITGSLLVLLIILISIRSYFKTKERNALIKKEYDEYLGGEKNGGVLDFKTFKREWLKSKKFVPFRKKVLFIVIFILGLASILFPIVSQYQYYVASQVVVKSFKEGASKLALPEIERRIKLAQAYNSTIKPELNGVADPFTDIQKEGRKEYARMLEVNEQIGLIEIPQILVDIPVYAGTIEPVLQKGAGHMEGTSLPVGGKNTNAVITAHRGLPNARLFTDLDKIKLNDVFYFQNIKEKLAYKVIDIKVVSPEDLSQVTLKKDRDIMTLLTCTPYMINSHRLLVIGERIPYIAESEAKSAFELKTSMVYRLLFYISLFLLILLLFILFLRYMAERIIKRNKERARMNALEKERVDESLDGKNDI